MGSRGASVLLSRASRIKSKLQSALKASVLEVEDVSYQHAGHAAVWDKANETHFNVKVVSKQQFHYMDKKEVGGDLSEDLTRESLIAISYRLPDKDTSPGPGLPKTLNNEDAADIVNSDGGSEKYRSKLISIAYTQSTDTKGVPVSPGQKVHP